MKLNRALVVLDLETTGTWVEKDKIIEIGMIKCLVDNSKEHYIRRVNPGILIPDCVSKIIGISNEDVKDCLFFKNIAKEVLEFIEGADLAGFNIERFDLPLLEREIVEAGLQFSKSDRYIYDAQKFFHIHEKRDLAAAYNFYCNKKLSKAHSALDDTLATLEILYAQIREYGNTTGYIEDLKVFDYERPLEYYDKEKKFRWWNNNLYPTFGKYAGKYSVGEILKLDKPYLEWILTQDFSQEIKIMIKECLNGQLPKFTEKAS